MTRNQLLFVGAGLVILGLSLMTPMEFLVAVMAGFLLADLVREWFR
jgi:hypothetical protein